MGAAANNSGLLPLSVAVNGDSLRLFLARRDDPAFEPFCRAVWQRDDYRCRYCGFRSGVHQEVVNIDGNYLNNRVSNLATACCFCQQCMFLSAIGSGTGSSGKLIWLPEMTQGQLNALVHVLFSMMYRGGGYGGLAQTTYQNLLARADHLSKVLNMDALADAGEVGRYLLNLDDAARDGLQQALFSRVRLLPIYASFSAAVGDWEQESKELLL